MARRQVLFVPGYADGSGPRAMAQRFAHALAVGGAGAPLILPLDDIDVVAPPDAWGGLESRAERGLSGVSDEERRVLSAVHASILESNGRMLRAPDPVLRDPHVAGGADAEQALLAAYFGPLYAYASDREVRYGLQDALKSALSRHSGREIVLVAHGLGAMVAYDTVFKLGPSAPPLTVVTLGAVIGLTSVQKLLKAKQRPDGFYPVPDRVVSWTNVTHPMDAVAGDPTLGDEFRWADAQRRIDDVPAQVATGWPFHRWEGYLQSSAARDALSKAVGVPRG